MNKSNPPMGFIARDWLKETKTCGLMLNEEMRPPGLVPIPVSEDNGKTLDWSQPRRGDSTSLASLHLNPAIQCEYMVIVSGLGTRTERGAILLDDTKLSAIRLSVPPKTLETASQVARDLRRRYDLLFFRLETPTPARLTAVARWAVSASRIPPHTWKAPIPTSMIEEYLAESTNTNGGFNPKPQTRMRDWKLVVEEFISTCDELGSAGEQHWSAVSPVDDQPRWQSRASSKASSRASLRKGSRASLRTGSRTSSRASLRTGSRASSRVGSRAGSIAEGHVSPEDDGPSRKVLYDDDAMVRAVGAAFGREFNWREGREETAAD